MDCLPFAFQWLSMILLQVVHSDHLHQRLPHSFLYLEVQVVCSWKDLYIRYHILKITKTDSSVTCIVYKVSLYEGHCISLDNIVIITMFLYWVRWYFDFKCRFFLAYCKSLTFTVVFHLTKHNFIAGNCNLSEMWLPIQGWKEEK